MERIERQSLTKEKGRFSELIENEAGRTGFFRNLPEDRQKIFLESVKRVFEFAVERYSKTVLRDAPRMVWETDRASEFLRKEKQTLSDTLTG
mgnify:CR=1 FL=1